MSWHIDHPPSATDPQFTSQYVPARLWVPASQFFIGAGSPTAYSDPGAPHWVMPDSAASIVAASVFIPQQWASFTVKRYMMGLGATTGNVKLDQRVYPNLADGATLTYASGSTSLSTAAEAVGGQYELMVDTIGTAVPATATLMHTLYFRRNGSDGSDTYAGTIGFIGYLLEKAS